MGRLSHREASNRVTMNSDWEEYREKRKEEEDKTYLKINYKFKKKCSSNLLIFNFLIILIDISYCNQIDVCSGEVQRDIFESMPQCLARNTLIDLREEFTNNSEIIEVVPDHVTVDRCGGSCYVHQYSCNPTKTSAITIPVMLVLSKWPHGEHDVLCSEVVVEVHHECRCGCKLEKHHCHQELQYYHQPSCRCICNNVAERSACLAGGKVWDPHSCQCHCPLHTVQPCSTGYMFDFSSTCSCVQVSAEASEGMVAAIVILSLSMAILIVAGLVMYNRKTGLFKESSESNITDAGDSESDQIRRTGLMSQKSRREYEVASREGNVTLGQFDERRDSEKGHIP